MTSSPTRFERVAAASSNSLEQARLGALAPLLELEREVVQRGALRHRRRRAPTSAAARPPRSRRRPAYGSSPSADRLFGRDPGGIEQVVGRRRLCGESGGLAGCLGEGRIDVGRVVELDQLGRGLDDLGLADPLAGDVVEVTRLRLRNVPSGGDDR